MPAASAQSADGGDGAVKDWNLRSISKRRLLQSMVREVISAGNPGGTQQNGGASASGRDRRKHPYIALVADPSTVMTIQATCEMHDLLHEGICLIEEINGERHALPMLDSIYFISPTKANVDRLVQDASDKDPEGKRNGPMYRTFNVFFSHKLPDQMLEIVAKSQAAAARMSTFCELNLSFAAFDSRGFHLGESGKLKKTLTRETLTQEEVEETGNKLATLLSTLGETKNIWYHSGKANHGSACDKLAQTVRTRVDEMEVKGTRPDQGLPPLNCNLIIVDRTVDITSLLAYDLRYESLIYDALGSEVTGIQENKYTFEDTSDNSNKTVVLTPEKDKYYGEFRHLPLWQVNAVVVDGIKQWTAQDALMRDRTAPPSSREMGQMVSSTLNALQALPEHKATFSKLHSHSEICQTCVKVVEQDELVDLTTLMNDLACDVDSDCSKLTPSHVEASLKKLMEHPNVSAETKARLMLLASISPYSAGNESFISKMAVYLEAPDAQILSSDPWVKAKTQLKEDLVTKRRKKVKERLRDGRVTPRSRGLCRWDPVLGDMIELAINNELDKHDFKNVMGAAEKTKGGKKTAVIVFVVGGVSLSEIRCAHEASARLGVEAFVGGSHLLTPRLFLESLRRAVAPPSKDSEGGDLSMGR